MTSYLLSIDLGLASGASLWEYSESEPATLLGGWEIPGGYEGLDRWLGQVHKWLPVSTIIAEKYIFYPTPGHSPTLASTYALVLEGVLIDRGLMPPGYDETTTDVWRRSSLQYWVKGANAKAKRKTQIAWLKESTDLYRTAGQLGVKHKDSEDYLSSVFHALSWFRSQGHGPTLAKYWSEQAETPGSD